MRNALVLLCLTFGFSITHAADLKCHQSAGSPDRRYAIHFDSMFKTADVFVSTYRRYARIAQLNCGRPAEAGQVANEAPRLFLMCSEPKLRDAGYSVQVYQTDAGPTFYADLSEITIMGSKRIARLTDCRYRD